MADKLYKAEDFRSGDGAGNRAIADRANALHDERCPNAKLTAEMLATNALLDAQRDAEIERLRAENATLAANLEQQAQFRRRVHDDAVTQIARLREALEYGRAEHSRIALGKGLSPSCPCHFCDLAQAALEGK